MFYYQAIEITVSTAGYYTLLCNSAMDTYGYLYNNSFNYLLPDLDILSSDDDSGGNHQFMFTIPLQSLLKYILVVTTLGEEVIGTFSLIATGPGLLSFSRTGM